MQKPKASCAGLEHGKSKCSTSLDYRIATCLLNPRPTPQPTMTLLWAGRLESMKAPLLMLQIMQQVADLPVRLLVAGDGPLRPMCEAKAKEFGIEHKVQFLGRVNWHQMKELYRSVDAFLFTSLRDSFGSVNLEAMSQALPLIAFDHQGWDILCPQKLPSRFRSPP